MAALDWASSSSAAPTTVSRSFDVFLSFRGKDIRNSFISFLYKSLKDRGINVFVDSEKQWIGEAIGTTLHKAIEGSKISIPVFSKGYADSKWCLQELALIVQCHRSNGQLILPIFYDVEPSHVRHQTGSFNEAFCEHEKKFNPNIVKEWRDALETVGNLIGEVLDETKNQAELVELVVKRVSGELIIKTNLTICEYPIGIDSSVNDLISLLNINSNDVQFVGICGFGGIGKTTIAKAVYNDLLLTFDKHSFLSDVREQAKQCLGLVSLQKRLLKDILKIDIDSVDVHKGKNLLEQRLCEEKVLVVLDDVDSQEQVDALAGKHTWFGKGSRIIITTRDEHILNVAKVNNVYRPQVLDPKKSLQLFSLHAFQKDQPPEDYMQLSRDVAHYSGGLPLTLKVLGSYLLDISDKEEWESTLQKLKEIPNDEIQTRLKISYDNLKDDCQKTIFLDAACFFIGWDKGKVISIWEACGCYPKSTVPSLIKRSLLNFEESWEGEYVLRMHDQIRDMGRKIVRTENPLEPGKRSRLWCYGDILDFLKGHKGTGRMRGMRLPYASSYPNLASEHFQMIPNLRFLDISVGNFVGDFSHFPSALRCLAWMCSWEIIPSNFSHDSLVYLDLSMSKIKQAWNVRPQDENKCFEKLKDLYLHRCQYLCKSPDFSWFPYLERLNLGGCVSLERLDESIGQLSELKYLILRFCISLNELPNAVGQLEKLEELDAKECYGLKKLPRSMERMRCLHSIYLSQCKTLEELPELPSSLVELNCNFCYSLVRLPDLSRLKILRKLKLNECLKLEKIQGLEGTESLEELDASGCYKLTRMPRKKIGQETLSPDMLLSGDCYYSSTAISKIDDDISSLKNLKRLELYQCNKLEELPDLPLSLVELCCDYCCSLERLPDLSRLKNLRKLKLKDCLKLEKIQGLEGTESLEELDVSGCSNLTHMQRKKIGQGTLLPDRLLSGDRYYSSTTISKIDDDISSLKNLKRLDLYRCNKLEELPELPLSLVELCCDYCCSLVRLPDLSRLKNLRKLKLKECKKIEEIQGLEGTESLEELDVSRCSNLTRMQRKKIGQGTFLPDMLLSGDRYYSSTAISKIPDDFSSLKNLKRLELYRCNKLEELPELPLSLFELCCGYCCSLVRLPDLSRLKILRKLKLKDCIKLEKIQSLEGAESLKWLELCRCNKLEELPELPLSLVELCCDYCYSLVKFRDLSRLKNLRKLKLKDCIKLEKIQGLEGIESLEELDASGCYNLIRTRRKKLGVGTLLPNRLLSGDHFYSSIAISKIPDDFSSLKNLKQLDLCQCNKLEELPELPLSLVELYCDYCYSLVRLPDLSRLKILRKLKFKDCLKLENIRGLEGIESLKELDASGCYNLTHTQKKKLGQGTILPDSPPVHGYSFTAAADGIYTNSTGLLLCIVFGYNSFRVLNGCIGTLDLRISASVCQKERTIRCLHSLKIEGVEFTTVRDTIYIHYFKGFDWFGIPLQGEDAIKISGIVGGKYKFRFKGFDCFDDTSFKVKFWKLFNENKEPDQQMPNQYSDASHSGNNMEEIELSDFFDLSCVYKASPSGNSEEEELDFFDWSRAYKPFPFDNAEDENVDDASSPSFSLGLTLPCPSVLMLLDDGSNQQTQVDQPSHVQENGKTPPPSPSHDTEEEDPERNNTMKDLLSCLVFDSVSDGVEKEGEMLSPSKRALLHDNNDEAPGPSLSLTLSTSSEMKSNNGFNLQQMLSQPPNIDDDDDEASGLSLSLALIPYQDF